MEDITNWFKTSLREDTLLYVDQAHRTLTRELLTDEYKEWETRCEGKVKFERDFTKENYIDPKCYIHFEKEEDLVNYKLTFDEISYIAPVDVAAFYCPYIPITMTSITNE